MNTVEQKIGHSYVKALQSDPHDPHSILGIHPHFEGKKIIRIWRPGARRIHIELFGKLIELKPLDEAGLFEYIVQGDATVKDYKVFHQNGLIAHDPYSFWPTIGEMDLYLLNKGVHYHLYNLMGARICKHQDVEGVKFSVWAPNAKSVSLVGDFNYWDGRVNPMRSMGVSGVWELFVPGLLEGERYKFEIKSQSGEVYLKADPYALSSELRPATASVVADIDRFQWEDEQWISQRVRKCHEPKPMNVYEIHLGSWKMKDGSYLNYREIARELVHYCHAMGFTHVELMPVQEHPLDESWGYQVSGYYAVTSRYGTPEDFQWFVNHLHVNHIGVILDWVPGHFPTDNFSLGKFDGTALYEHDDPRQGLHPHWYTHIFNFGRNEVKNFLIANAFFWIGKMHVDGLRVDAVASMLYLDYGREANEWIPNSYGGKENLEAIEFFKHLNSVLHEYYPGILTIAEESTSFQGITQPLEHGGLGFDMKWNMGWMNDTLRYFTIDPFFRHYHQNDLTFGLLYAFSEKFQLVLSHDEVVHGKRALISKMPGDYWQKFANVRLLLSYMMCQPGKKLLFMGGEIGQWNEWNVKREVEWSLLEYAPHKGLQDMVRDINHLYLRTGCMWECDFQWQSFEWVDFGDRINCIISYFRKGSLDQVLCVHNFTPTYHDDYILNVRGIKHIQQIFNSDAIKYGGSGKENAEPHILHDHNGKPYAIKLKIAPLATMIFKVERE